MREGLGVVGQKFKLFMAELNCQGEVELVPAENDMQFDKWGVKIRVSFRHGSPLQELGEKFSGGERAVTTMLFLMALQGVLPNPFRVVDEINQVLDCLM